jgi:hypothetical protein
MIQLLDYYRSRFSGNVVSIRKNIDRLD